MENRRLLGTETITTVSGDEKEISVYAMGFVEKMNLVKKFTKTTYIKGFSYKEVDEASIMLEVLGRCIKGATIEELDYNAQDIYEKCFKKKEESEDDKKKDNTSTTTLLDTQ